MSNPSPNSTHPIFGMFADITRAHASKLPERMRELNDHAAEGTLLHAGSVDITCAVKAHLFTVTRTVDDFGTPTTTGGVRIRGRWVCADHEYEAVCAYLDDLSGEPVYDADQDWFRLEDSEKVR